MLDASLVLPLLLLLAGAALPAVVLPRPPSSPNYIPVEYAAAVPPDFNPSKSYFDKAFYQKTNVEKPDTQQDYRFLEIEVRDAENVNSLDLHGIVQAVLNKQRRSNARRFDDNGTGYELMSDIDVREHGFNVTYPRAEIVPRSIVGVREVGLAPGQRFYESATLEDANEKRFYPFGPSRTNKDLSDEKLYYLKNGRPKVYVNFRGRSGNFRQDTATGADSRFTLRLEPSTFLRATQPYHTEKKTKSPKSPPKKYDPRLHGSSNGGSSTTENAMVTSSELPKQIPAPPSRIPLPSPIVHTTPVQRYTARRTDILPGYAFAEV